MHSVAATEGAERRRKGHEDHRGSHDAALGPYKQPFHWSLGVTHGAEVILVEVHTDEGVVGYGESIAAPSADAVRAHLSLAADFCVGRSPFENARLIGEACNALFGREESSKASTLAGKSLAGLEMALWDAMGKAAGCPVHALLGGAVRDEVRYFGFPQGDTAGEIASEAARLAASGHEVIFLEVGRGDDLDAEVVARVRAAIGPDKRLRLDPNGRWHSVQATRMMRRLSQFDIEVVEQPIHAESVEALARVRATSPVSIAADQGVIALGEAFDLCRLPAADLLVVGLHETGGLLRFCKVAHIAEAANIDVCIHGLHETGITTVAASHVAAVTPQPGRWQPVHEQLSGLGHRGAAQPGVAGRHAARAQRAGAGLRAELGCDSRGGRGLVEGRRRR